MPSTLKALHGIFAFGSLSAAMASLLISVRMGALKFIQDNIIDGLLVDVWDGFFSSPKNLTAIAFLMFLPIHCYSIQAPSTIFYLTAVMAIPSSLFLVGMLLELSPVLLPVGIVVGCFGKFGLSEFKLARQVDRDPLKASPTRLSDLKSMNQNSIEKQIKNRVTDSLDHHLPSPRSSQIQTHQQNPLAIKPSKLSSPSLLSKRKRRES